jgi:hypothetical protein
LAIRIGSYIVQKVAIHQYYKPPLSIQPTHSCPNVISLTWPFYLTPCSPHPSHVTSHLVSGSTRSLSFPHPRSTRPSSSPTHPCGTFPSLAIVSSRPNDHLVHIIRPPTQQCSSPSPASTIEGLQESRLLISLRHPPTRSVVSRSMGINSCPSEASAVFTRAADQWRIVPSTWAVMIYRTSIIHHPRRRWSSCLYPRS